MPKGATLKWYGVKVKNATIGATRKGMDYTMSKCVQTTKSNTPVVTSTLQGSMQMRPTVKAGKGLLGRWGSFKVIYAAAVEGGSKPHIIRPKNKKALFWAGAMFPVKEVKHPGTKGKHMMRNASRKHYPRLIASIRSFM